MNWFLNISIRGKLMLAFGVMILLTLAAIGAGSQAIATLASNERQLYELDLSNRYDMASLVLEENGVRADLLSMAVAANEADRTASEESLRETSRRIDTLETALLERNRDDAAFVARFDEFRRLRALYVDTRDNQIIPLIRAGDVDQATDLAAGAQFDRFLEIRERLNELAGDAEARAAAARRSSAAATEQTNRVFVTVGLLVVAVSVFLVVVLARAIASPVSRMSAAAGEIARGNFDLPLPDEVRRDEVGTLSRAFSEMANSLARTNAELQEGIGVLASSASEIVASSSQVTAAASETATAVSQSMATVEEVNQAAELSAEKAASVAEAARRVSEVSEEGRQSTEQTIDGIRKIQAQMESIAGSIVRLSEQAQTIGDVIATVNDLAEQSNLLAVNAAIEASRAGEHGRGFAVVAQEIRNLASRSKDATGQVRKIINDIQSAMTAAVMATEQGTKAAETGVELSARTAEAIEKLAETIAESSQLAVQIGASSRQQKVGMDQVALAVENIKQASAQNVAATRQTDDAARNIEELGRRLKGLVNRYRGRSAGRPIPSGGVPA